MATPPSCSTCITAPPGISAPLSGDHSLHQHRKSADVRFGSTDNGAGRDSRTTLEFSYKDIAVSISWTNTYETITLTAPADARRRITGRKLPLRSSLRKAVRSGECPPRASSRSSRRPRAAGDTASNVTKPALLETGKTVKFRSSLTKAKRSDRYPHRRLYGPA